MTENRDALEKIETAEKALEILKKLPEDEQRALVIFLEGATYARNLKTAEAG